MMQDKKPDSKMVKNEDGKLEEVWIDKPYIPDGHKMVHLTGAFYTCYQYKTLLGIGKTK